MNQCRFSAHWKWTSGLRFANRRVMPSWWMSRRKQPTQAQATACSVKHLSIDCCSLVTISESKLQCTTGLCVLCVLLHVLGVICEKCKGVIYLSYFGAGTSGLQLDWSVQRDCVTLATMSGQLGDERGGFGCLFYLFSSSVWSRNVNCIGLWNWKPTEYGVPVTIFPWHTNLLALRQLSWVIVVSLLCSSCDPAETPFGPFWKDMSDDGSN